MHVKSQSVIYSIPQPVLVEAKECMRKRHDATWTEPSQWMFQSYQLGLHLTS